MGVDVVQALKGPATVGIPETDDDEFEAPIRQYKTYVGGQLVALQQQLAGLTTLVSEGDWVAARAAYPVAHGCYERIGAVYDAFGAGRSDPLQPLTIHYKDYAAWQRRLTAGPESDRMRSYWRGKLGGSSPALTLPTDWICR